MHLPKPFFQIYRTIKHIIDGNIFLQSCELDKLGVHCYGQSITLTLICTNFPTKQTSNNLLPPLVAISATLKTLKNNRHQLAIITPS